jgi:hypothetical protein
LSSLLASVAAAEPISSHDTNIDNLQLHYLIVGHGPATVILWRVALALIGKIPGKEPSSNLHRLKEIVERGRVTDATCRVTDKFAYLGINTIREMRR